jgi:hypothetical protein
MGNKLDDVASVVRHDSVNDGPFIEFKEIVGGYMMLSADSHDEAVTVIQESPMVANGGTSIEIREICAP